MAAYEEKKAELETLGAKIYATAVYTEEQAKEMVDRGLLFQAGYDVTEEQADNMGSWWSEDRGGYVQPPELLAATWRGRAEGPCTPRARMDAWAPTRLSV